MVLNIFVFSTFAILWLAFGAALVLNPASLDVPWHSFRDLPLVVQELGVLLLVPLVLGLWVRETPWPLWLRLLLVIRLGWWTLMVLFPGAVTAREAEQGDRLWKPSSEKPVR